MFTNLQITLAKRPTGPIVLSGPDQTFVPRRASSIPELKDGELLIEVLWVSLDPAMRGWLREARSYIEPVKIGEVMRAGGIGRVVESRTSKFAKGDLVEGTVGWQEYAVMREKGTRVVRPPMGADPVDYLGALGMVGMTAYFGLFDVAKAQAGELVVVSGAAGATGSLVCQMAKITGCKVVGIAGSDDKCEWLEKDLGIDKAVNYKSKDFVKQIKAVGYIDAFFDNVGGEILDLILTRLKPHARVALCGAISDYTSKPRGLQAYTSLISMRARIEGFIVFDYVKQFHEAERRIAEWIAQGKLKRRFHVVRGLGNSPQGLLDLFDGRNTGKTVVQVKEDVRGAPKGKL